MASIVIERMMKETDLPRSLRAFQVLIKPVELLGIHVIAVQRKESNIALAKRIVSLSAHIERLVETFIVGIVVIAQRSEEFYAGVKHRLIRLLELLYKILRRVAAVDVVAKHDDEVEFDGQIGRASCRGRVEIS